MNMKPLSMTNKFVIEAFAKNKSKNLITSYDVRLLERFDAICEKNAEAVMDEYVKHKK